MIKAEDMGEFYRVPADNRDLNYAQYWKGTRYLIEDYHSHNTEQWVWKE
jgi:UDP-glucose 4-epimerase